MSETKTDDPKWVMTQGRFRAEQEQARLRGQHNAIAILADEADRQAGSAYGRHADDDAKRLRMIAEWIRTQDASLRDRVTAYYATVDATPAVTDETGAEVEW